MFALTATCPVALETADVALMGDDLTSLADGVVGHEGSTLVVANGLCLLTIRRS